MAREGAARRGRNPLSDLERARDHWLTRAEAFAAGRPAGDPLFIEALRTEAAGGLAAAGLPSRGHEEWRYTNVAPIARGGFEPAPPVTGRSPARTSRRSRSRSSPVASSSS